MNESYKGAGSPIKDESAVICYMERAGIMWRE